MIVITGAAGFIGSALVWQLNRMDCRNLILVDRLGRDERWKNLRALDFDDLADPDVFLERFEAGGHFGKPVAVVHLGACSATTETDCDYLYRNNFEYSRRLALACRDRGARLVHAGSAASYGAGEHGCDDDPEILDRLRPLNMYGYSKHLFDRWARREGLLDRIASVKFFNVYGPNEYHKGDMASLVFKAVGQIRETGVLRLFKSYRPEYPDGGQRRDFVYVKDVVRVLAWLIENPAACGLLNVGSGQARSWNDLARAVFAAMDRPPRIEYIDMPPALRGQYQYFTEAPLARLRRQGCDLPMTALEDGVSDYVRRYLPAEARHLDPGEA